MNKQDVEYLRGTLIKATETDSYELPFQSVVKVFIRNREQWSMARAHKIPIYREDVHELASGHQYKRLYILLTFEQIIVAADNIYNK